MKPKEKYSKISVPKNLIDELNRMIPHAQRQYFIESILKRELRRLTLREVLKKSYGAWEEKDHPELATFEDINNWVETIRKNGNRVLKQNELT